MTKLIYPELSYQIIGSAYEVYNILGKGRPEKYYQKAMSAELEARNVKFKEQVYYTQRHKEQVIGKTFFDFVVEEKIVVELKQGEHFSQVHFNQLLNYLKVSELKLGLLINFSGTGVKIKRVLNIY